MTNLKQPTLLSRFSRIVGLTFTLGLLVLANLGFLAWTQGGLGTVAGLRSQGDREPERLARQFQPQNVRILPPGEAASAMAASAASGAISCLEAGPFSLAEANLAEGIVQAALPAGSWARRTVEPAEPAPGVMLRVERADAALVAQIAALGGEVKGQPVGAAFRPCATKQ